MVCAKRRRRKATELNRHTTRMKIRGSVVSLSFILPHPLSRLILRVLGQELVCCFAVLAGVAVSYH